MRKQLEEFRALCRGLPPDELSSILSAVTVERFAKDIDLDINERETVRRCADKWWRRAWEANNKRTGANNG